MKVPISWLKDFVEYGKKDGVYILIGNKSDLIEARTTPTEKGQELATRIKAADFIETSALNGDNVEEAFKTIQELTK